jgi:hypothetical protein
MEGMPGMGMDAQAKLDPRAYRIDYSKRRLRAELYTVQLALGKKKRASAKGDEEPSHGLVAYASAAADTAILDSIRTQVEDVIRVVETLDQTAEVYEKDLRKEMKKLEGSTKPLPVAAAKVDVAKAAPEDEVPGAKPAAAKPAVEEPMEEIPMAATPTKAPAAKGKAPAAAPGKEAPPPAAEKAAPPAPPAGKTAPPAGK